MYKPIDKYKTYKIPLKNIIHNDVNYDKLHDAITRTNNLVIHVYQFMKLWTLKKYRSRKTIPEINEDIIRMIQLYSQTFMPTFNGIRI